MTNEKKEASDWLDRNIISFDVIVKNAELIELLKWANESFINGAALHIIIEDGNYEDSHLEYCKNYITSGEWDKACKDFGDDYTIEENQKMLRIIELMEPLTKEEREMLDAREVMTSELFDMLYNKAINHDN